MPLTIGNVSLYVGPQQLGASDNLEQVIIDFIDGAQKRLEIAVQEIDNWNIAKAIIRAKQRKVTTTVVLEGDYLISYPGLKDPYTEGGSLAHNREIFAALSRAGVNVKLDFNTSIFHQKFVIRDRESLLTGSTNFTETGVTKNLNHIMIFKDKEISSIYYREFREIMQGHFGKLNEGHDPTPDDTKVSGVPVRILFAPDHNPEMEIMKQMQKAKSRVDFAIFTFSQSSGIDDTMVVLEKAGISVRGVFDGKAGNQSWAATRMVHDAGGEAYLASKTNPGGVIPGTLGKLHHKLMVIDEQVVIGGSFNYTGPANALNDENIFIIGDMADATSAADQKKFGKYALDEIDRIIQVFGDKVV
ncbi:MAG: phospholipase D-like domain-containing protein [Bacteroidota bacterium]